MWCMNGGLGALGRYLGCKMSSAREGLGVFFHRALSYVFGSSLVLGADTAEPCWAASALLKGSGMP